MVENEAVSLAERRNCGRVAEVEMERPRGGHSNRVNSGRSRMLRHWLIEGGFLINKSAHRDSEHAEQCAEREHVAGVGRAARQRDIGNSIDKGDGGALPEEVDQSPAEGFPVVCHGRFLF